MDLSSIDDALRSVGLRGWMVVKEEERTLITKSYTFKSFPDALAFMVKVGFEAERMDHHPEWSNVYNKVSIILSTHTEGGVTEKDITLASYISKTSDLFV